MKDFMKKKRLSQEDYFQALSLTQLVSIDLLFFSKIDYWSERKVTIQLEVAFLSLVEKYIKMNIYQKV